MSKFILAAVVMAASLTGCTATPVTPALPEPDPLTAEQRKAELEAGRLAEIEKQKRRRAESERKRKARIERERLLREQDNMQATIDAWQVREFPNAITDRIRYKASNWTIGDDVLSVFCDVEVSGESQLAVTFSTETSVATPSSEVDFTVRIDKNEPMTFTAYTYSNSYDDMYFDIKGPQGRKLVDQMKSGEDVNIRIIKYSQSHTFSTTVKGATDAFTEVVGKCS